MSNRGAWAVAIIAILAVLLVNPLAELSWNDDWCYGRMAYEFARSGKFVYNGWAAAMVGPQAVWGALWIKLFGFSFTVLRLSTLPVFVGCGALLYGLHRRAGLREELAVLGSLTILLSPLILPLAASFMTDIFGFFFLLLTITLALKALDADKGKAVLSIALVVVVGLLAGAIRQTFWLAPLVALGYLAWKRSELRPVALGGLGGALLGSLVLSVWYSKQPYALGESVVPGIKGIVHNPVPSLLTILGLLMGITLFLFPVLSLYVVRSLALAPTRTKAIVLALAALLSGVCLWQRWLFPWSYNIFSEFGVLRPADTALGEPSLVLTTLPRLLLSFLALASSLCVLSVLVARRRELLAALKATDSLIAILGLYSVPYLLIALSRAGIGMSWDRYLLPVFPLMTILALRALAARPLPKAAWGVLALTSLYSISISHDYLAFLRAEVAAIETLKARKIPATQIRANFEFDCWTEMDQAGYFNDARIHNPPGAYKEYTDEQMRGDWPTGQKVPWWWRFTPHVEGRYFVVTTPIAGLSDTTDAPITYQRWLPWTTATIRIQQKPTGN